MANVADGDEEPFLLSDPDEDEFLGFSPVRAGIPEEHNKQQVNKKKGPSKTLPKSQKPKKKTAKSSVSGPVTDGNTNSDNVSLSHLIKKLKPEDIDSLRNLLGVYPQPIPYADDEDIQSIFGDTLENLPHLSVEVVETSDDEAVQPQIQKSKQTKKRPLQPLAINNELQNALFQDNSLSSVSSETVGEYDTWDLPRLKQPEKGPNISHSLANLINTACSSQCVTDNLIEKFKVPENCEKLAAPRVNNEFWKVLNKRAQGYDKYFSDTQNLVAAAIVSNIHLAESIKGQISQNAAAKELMTNTLTLMGQVQYNLSIRRRYMIRPHLKKKYQNLCNFNVPITSNLFGDDLPKEIRNCDAAVSVARDNYGYGGFRPNRGRGYYRGPRGQRGGFRYQPYPPQYQHYGGNNYSQYGGGSFRGNSKGFAPMKGRRTVPTATVSSAPNEN